MAYNDAIESLKKALEGYSEEEERIKALYAKARNALETGYGEEIAANERDRLAKRADAEADVKRQERNGDIMLAQRGLSFSGEAAQSRLGSALALNKRLAEIDSAHEQSKRELAKTQSENLLKTDAEEAKRTAEARESKNRTLRDIAGLEAKRDAEEARVIRGAAEEAQADLTEENGGYRPPITARVLAEQMVNSVNSKGYVSKAWEMKRIAEKLEELTKGYDIDKDYLDDLIFSLRAYGYTEPKKETRSSTEILADEAETFYKSSYATTYAACQMAGFPESYSAAHAKEKASEKLFDYLYERVTDAKDFRNICTVLGISNAAANEYLEKQRIGGEGPAQTSK